MYKKSNKPNITQKLDFIPANEPNRKLFSLFATEKSTTKTILADEQEHIILPAKNPQRQVQNPNIVYEKAEKAQKVVYELENKSCSCFCFLSFTYNDNNARPAISLFFATQNAAITNLAREYNQGADE